MFCISIKRSVINALLVTDTDYDFQFSARLFFENQHLYVQCKELSKCFPVCLKSVSGYMLVCVFFCRPDVCVA